MRPLLPLLLLPLLAACAPGPSQPFPGLFGSREVEPEGPPPLPLAVQQALPPGVPASVVLQDAAGCYLYSIERTEPASGYPLRDAQGTPICDGNLSTAVAAAPALPPAPIAPITAAPAPEVIAPEPLATEPLEAEPSDFEPRTTDPLEEPIEESADPPEAETIFLDPILPAPGSITPPAPLAPLN